MKSEPRVAILWRGDRVTRSQAMPENNRFSPVAREFEKHGFRAEPAVYDEAFVDEVRQQLGEVDGVLVWVNPIQDETDRTTLDEMSWGGDIYLYQTVEELREHLPVRLAAGESRVLKQNAKLTSALYIPIQTRQFRPLLRTLSTG